MSSIETNNSSLKQLDSCHLLRPLGYYLCILWILGTSLNGSILFVFIRYKKLRQSSTNIFIGGLIFADFLGACFEIPLPAIALFNCRWIFSYVGCVIEAIIAYFAGCSNIYMLCLISIDRYFVVKKSLSNTSRSVKQSYLIIFSVYMLALFWTLAPVIGWSTYDYEGIGASCSIKWEDRSFNVVSYNITIMIFVYLIPVIVIIITNIEVIKEIHQRENRLNRNFNEQYRRRRFLIERRVTHTVIFIIGGFLIAWTPYAITVAIRLFVDETSFPPILATIPAILAKTSVVWNPFIYVIRNGNIRIYLPMHRHLQQETHRARSEPIRFSVYPYCNIHLPLETRLNSANN